MATAHAVFIDTTLNEKGKAEPVAFAWGAAQVREQIARERGYALLLEVTEAETKALERQVGLICFDNERLGNEVWKGAKWQVKQSFRRGKYRRRFLEGLNKNWDLVTGVKTSHKVVI